MLTHKEQLIEYFAWILVVLILWATSPTGILGVKPKPSIIAPTGSLYPYIQPGHESRPATDYHGR